MKNYNKNLCTLALIMLLGLGNAVYSFDEITANNGIQSGEVQEKIKANRETLDKAQEAMDAKDFASAINYLNGYIGLKSGKYEAYKMRGDAYYALRRYDLAQKDYQTAIDIKAPGDKLVTNAKYVSAIVLGADKDEQLQNVELGNLYGALMYAQKALNNPEYTLSYDNAVRYNTHIFLPQPNKTDINKINCPQKYAKQLTPTGIDATIASAISDIEKNDFHSSVFKIQNVINEYPDYYMGYYLMGVALTGLEKDDEAIKSFEKAVSLNPYDFESYASLGQIYFDKAETNFSDADAKKSMEYFSKALEYNKNCPTYHFYMGLNELNTGNYNSAINSFNNATKINENDYNSIYYRAIAQYITGDYNSVIPGVSKLISRHVSNCNSVLYLRALAYNKLGQKDKALADLDTIGENLHDVFNSDIRENSEKDTLLAGYVEYLRSVIDNSNSVNTNPIIKKLASVQASIKPYENIINAKSITEEDYKKLEGLYTATLPKMLAGTFVTYENIDTQYDFIRTTFSDLGITFEPKGNDSYVFTTVKDYCKKYEQKVNSLTPSLREDSPLGEMSFVPDNAINFTSYQSDEKKLLQPGETSLAQMLASGAIARKSGPAPKYQPPVVVNRLAQPVISEDALKTTFKPEIPDGEKVAPSSVVTSEEPYVPTKKQLITDNNMQKVKNIIAEENNISQSKQTMVFTAPEIKQSEQFRIYNEPVNKTVETVKKTVQAETDSDIKIADKKSNEISDTAVKNIAEVPAVSNIKKEDAPALRQTVAQISTTMQAANNVLSGLSSAKTYDIGNSDNTVELDLTKLSYNKAGATELFQTDRLGFGVGAKPVYTVFDSDVKSIKNKTVNTAAETKEKIAATETDYSNKVGSVKDDLSDYMETKIKPVPKEVSNINVTDVVVPQLKASPNAPAIRLENPENIAEVETVPPSDAENPNNTEKANQLLQEYERLLKAQQRNERVNKEKEALQLKEQEKAQKLHEKEEKELENAKIKEEKLLAKQTADRIKAEQKAKEAQVKAEEKAQKAVEKAKVSEEKLLAKKADEEIKAKQKELDKQLKAERAKALAEQKAKESQLKAQKAAEQQQIKEREKLAKQQEKALAKAQKTPSDTPNLISKIKDKFQKTTDNSAEKLAKEQEKTQKKLQAQKLKEERAKAIAEQKAKENKLKAQKTAEQQQIKEREKIAKQQEKALIKAQQEQEKVISQTKEAKNFGSDNIGSVKNDISSVFSRKALPKVAVTSSERQETPNIIVPKLKNESKTSIIKLQNPENMANIQEVSVSKAVDNTKNETLQEYNRLLKEQEKREKLLKEEEIKQLKEQEKVQKEQRKEQEKFLENRHKEYIRAKEEKMKNAVGEQTEKQSLFSKIKDKFKTKKKDIRTEEAQKKTVLKSVKDGNTALKDSETENLAKVQKKAEKEQLKAAQKEIKAKQKAQKEIEKALKKALKEQEKAQKASEKQAEVQKPLKKEKPVNNIKTEIKKPEADANYSLNRYIHNAVKGRKQPALRI